MPQGSSPVMGRRSRLLNTLGLKVTRTGVHGENGGGGYFGGGYFGSVKRPSTHPANGGAGEETPLDVVDGCSDMYTCLGVIQIKTRKLASGLPWLVQRLIASSAVIPVFAVSPPHHHALCVQMSRRSSAAAFSSTGVLRK